MKKISLLVFLVSLAPYSIFGISASSFTSTFHNNLPENLREEISIIDEHTVKVGLGSDQRSVSCTLLDAVGSIPSINGTAEPDVVYVNKEKVHHIRKGLYTWDRAGKYRVRLTTKYIRKFGDIIVRVPTVQTAMDHSEPPFPSMTSYYQSLPENRREEISIIDSNMVEVGLGSDLKTVASNIQDAIKSIPSVGSKTFPEFVYVNEEPIFFIGNGLYSWDSEGANPVRLTAPFIKKFGNIRVSIPVDLPEIERGLPSPAIGASGEPPVELTKKATAVKTQALKNEKLLIAPPTEETLARVPEPPQAIETEKPSAPSTKARGFWLKGFRKAHFGMDISQVKQAIREDFNIEDSEIETFGKEKNILAISTGKLSENGESASVQYLFKNNKLARINVLWGPSQNTDKLAAELVQQFLSLKFMKNESPQTQESQLYHGKDSHGNKLKLSWAKMPNNNTSQRPLSLSYLAFAP